jgi:hypothetical protein
MGVGEHGIVSWAPDSWDELPPDVRERARQALVDRHRERGPLQLVVSVQVYAAGAEPSVTFTPACALGVESDPTEIAAAVARARQCLAEWR